MAHRRITQDTECHLIWEGKISTHVWLVSDNLHNPVAMNFYGLAIRGVKIFLAGFSVVVLKLEGSKIIYKHAELIHVGKQLLNKWFLLSNQ